MYYQQPPQSDKMWFYLSMCLLVAFCGYQGWEFYQNNLKTEKKILKMQKALKQRKILEEARRRQEK